MKENEEMIIEIPSFDKPYPELTAHDIVGVQPLTKPVMYNTVEQIKSSIAKWEDVKDCIKREDTTIDYKASFWNRCGYCKVYYFADINCTECSLNTMAYELPYCNYVGESVASFIISNADKGEWHLAKTYVNFLLEKMNKDLIKELQNDRIQ